MIDMPDIVAAAMMHYRISRRDLMGNGTARCYARPRQVAMVMCRAHTRRSLPRIGAYFGRCHSTVLHAMRAIGDGAVAERAAILEMATRIAQVRIKREQTWAARLTA